MSEVATVDISIVSFVHGVSFASQLKQQKLTFFNAENLVSLFAEYRSRPVSKRPIAEDLGLAISSRQVIFIIDSMFSFIFNRILNPTNHHRLFGFLRSTQSTSCYFHGHLSNPNQPILLHSHRVTAR